MCSASVFRVDAEFDAFLFAPVAEDKNGLLLNVISALVRSDLDPWIEAAKLARLPTKAAAERLAGLIAALPDETLAQSDPGKIADRLISLLPRQVIPKVPMSPSVGALIPSKHRVIVLCAVILLCMALGQLLFAGFGSQTTPIGETAPTARTTSP